MTWKRNWMMAGVTVAAMTGVANAQAPAPAQPAQPAQGQPAAGAQPAQGNRPAGDMPGPIDNLRDAQETGRMVFGMADVNNDGQISQKEAIDAANLLVGGFFFRADQNGDGTLSQDEARQARESLYAQQPVLRYVVEKARFQAKQGGGNNNAAATNPASALGSLLDANNDKQLQASELRQAVQTGVQGAFAVIDTNRDGQLSPTEINAAIIGAARTAAQAGFQQADNDRNGQLSKEEYRQAITEPADMVFAILDGNNDGQISQQEAEGALRIISSQLRGLMVPEPANSARNLLRSGTSPDQAAPIPNIPTPAAGGAQPRQ